MAEEKQQSKEWLLPILILGIVAGAFFVGRLSAQVEYLKGVKGAETVAQVKTETETGNVPPQVQGAKTRDLTIAGLKVMAAAIGLDEGSFSSCLDSDKYKEKIVDDTDYGSDMGVSGTPTFFINGVMLVGAQPQSEFEKVIDAELKDGTGDKATSAAEGRKQIKTGVGYIRGNADAVIKIVEFSDFECPFCERANPTVVAVMAKYGDKVSLEYRHYPLSFHPNAQKAAEASECAGEQGKFWEMHDKMFEG